MESPADKDAGGEADEGNEKTGKVGTDHAIDGVEVFGREVTDGEGTLGLENEDTLATALATGEVEASEDDAGNEQDEGAIAEGSEEGILPFEVRGEGVGIGRLKAISDKGEQDGAEKSEDDEEGGEQAGATSGLWGRIEDNRVRGGGKYVVFDGLCVARVAGLYHILPACCVL